MKSYSTKNIIDAVESDLLSGSTDFTGLLDTIYTENIVCRVLYPMREGVGCFQDQFDEDFALAY